MTARIIVFLGHDSDALLSAAALHLAEHKDHASRFWPEIGVTSRWPLHPAEHGDVADAIIASSAAGARVVVTHSDVFVLRLRRRVAEGSLHATAVDLRWVRTMEVVPIVLDDRGNPSWWPPGVFAEPQVESNAVRRVLAERDRAAAIRAEQPTLPEAT